jgi:hypothetical protein
MPEAVIELPCKSSMEEIGAALEAAMARCVIYKDGV